MKKVVFSVLIIMFFILLLTNNALATGNVTSNKKVVSLVFDDSGSMSGEKAEHANYALQSLISMLGKDDELNIVRMSEPTLDNVIKINEKIFKQNSIDEIRTWESKGNTPFETIETAKRWLNTRKLTLNDNAEYWFIIISDGQFGQGLDMHAYMNEINQNYIGLNFNALLVSIGKDIMPSYVEAFRNLPNCYSQEIETVNQIIPTMFEISSQINSGVNIQAIDAKKIDKNKISVDLSLPIDKMNIFIQKNGLEITSIETSNNKQIQFDTYNIATSQRSAKMNEVLTSKGYLESGKYTITFNKEVDLDATQIKILVRSAVTNELRLYKRTENKDKELEDVDFFTLQENDEIIAKSKLVSLVDGKNIELQNLKDVNGYYYINDKKVSGKLEKGELVTKIPLEQGKNTIYSLIESQGYIKEKSNTRVINLINLQEVLIQYNNSNKYEKNGEIQLEEMSNITNITLNNLPEGVVVEYDEIEYSNGEKILLNENDKTLHVKANKNYRETSSKIVEITGNEDGTFKQTESNKNYFRVGPKTTKYEIVKVDKNQNEIDMNNKLLRLEVQYEGFKNIEKLDVTNIKNIKINNTSKGYKITTKLNNQTNEIELNIKPTILSVFAERKVMFQIEVELKDSLGNAFGQFELGIINYNILEVLLPWIIATIAIIIIFGYIFKNRFNKNGYITISSESQPYSLRQCVEKNRKYIPFVADIAQLPNIKVKAKKGNKIQVISCFDEIVEINGETEITKDMTLSINNGTLTLNIDGKNIKYEYVALTADEIIETSEENNQKEENYF